MTIPDYQALMLPVLRAAASGETRVPKGAEIIADQLGLSPQEREELLPSRQQAYSIIASTGPSSTWARPA